MAATKPGAQPVRFAPEDWFFESTHTDPQMYDEIDEAAVEFVQAADTVLVLCNVPQPYNYVWPNDLIVLPAGTELTDSDLAPETDPTMPARAGTLTDLQLLVPVQTIGRVSLTIKYEMNNLLRQATYVSDARGALSTLVLPTDRATLALRGTPGSALLLARIGIRAAQPRPAQPHAHRTHTLPAALPRGRMH